MSIIIDARIENSFIYHAPTPDQIGKYEAIRNKTKELAYLILEVCPEGRYRALAQTAIEEAGMWANKSIACHVPKVKCSNCGGYGAIGGFDITCPSCNGTGFV